MTLTTIPYEDGFEWRKYGEKRINGTQFTRSISFLNLLSLRLSSLIISTGLAASTYAKLVLKKRLFNFVRACFACRSHFRCTYKDDKGCLATKQVQQKDNSDPPMFQVTYNNDHTCNCTAAAGNNLPLSFLGCCNNNNRSEAAAISNSPRPKGVLLHAAAAAAMVKQEPPAAVPPPLPDAASALPYYLDDHQTTTFQEALFPITNRSHHITIDTRMAAVYRRRRAPPIAHASPVCRPATNILVVQT